VGSGKAGTWGKNKAAGEPLSEAIVAPVRFASLSDKGKIREMSFEYFRSCVLKVLATSPVGNLVMAIPEQEWQNFASGHRYNFFTERDEN
jgi:hypothetical protein